jgi:hypothetical protein
MRRSLLILAMLLALSCTCFSYNAMISQRSGNIGNDSSTGATTEGNSDTGVDARNYKGRGTEVNTGGYSSTGADDDGGGNIIPSTSGKQINSASGYPPLVTDPRAQTAVALGYPAPCNNAGAVNKKDGVISGILAYTIYNGTDKPNTTISNIKRVAYRYDGKKFTLAAPVPLAITIGADGVATLPDGDLVVGSERNAYYTNSNPPGFGSIGLVNLATFTTVRKIRNLPAAHGIVFDHFTNTLIVVGSNHITQIDPKTFSIVSDWVAPPAYSAFELDQAAVDGRGHLWAASNDGNLVFIDYSHTRKVANPANYRFLQYLENHLDDVTLLCGS